jgi:hypothetical protein
MDVEDLRERSRGGSRHEAHDPEYQPLRTSHAEFGTHAFRALLEVVDERPEQLHELQDVR